jgi:DNA-binding LacI/PurR family transcriptional regulator
MELVSGVEQELSIHSYALLLQMVPDDRADSETGIYRKWWHERRVDGVLLCDMRNDDPRVPAVHELGLPAVVIGPPGAAGPLPGIWADDTVSVDEAVDHLAALGHRRIARVAGIRELAHTATRTRAFAWACARHGLAAPATVWTDYSGEDGARATRALLSAPEPATAVIYDNDIMAVAGLAVAQEMGREVPGDLSIIAWDDSPVCPLVHPPLTALSRDIAAHGARAARLLLATIAGEPVTDERDDPAHLTVRASTARPAGV